MFVSLFLFSENLIQVIIGHFQSTKSRIIVNSWKSLMIKICVEHEPKLAKMD